jgi:hypothetical protein
MLAAIGGDRAEWSGGSEGGLTPSFERRRAFVDDPPRLCSLMSACL